MVYYKCFCHAIVYYGTLYYSYLISLKLKFVKAINVVAPYIVSISSESLYLTVYLHVLLWEKRAVVVYGG